MKVELVLLVEKELWCLEFEDLGHEFQVADCAFEVVLFSLVVECVPIEVVGQAQPGYLLCQDQVDHGLLESGTLAEDARDGIQIVLDELS